MSDKKLLLEPFEIASLNIESLNVEELEQRLEMALGVPVEYAWVCGCDGCYQWSGPCECNSFIPCQCNGYTCSTLCTSYYEPECPAYTPTDCTDYAVQ